MCIWNQFPTSTHNLALAFGSKVAVFKPEDEEPQAPNNPKGYRWIQTESGSWSCTGYGITGTEFCVMI